MQHQIKEVHPTEVAREMGKRWMGANDYATPAKAYEAYDKGIRYGNQFYSVTTPRRGREEWDENPSRWYLDNFTTI